MSKKHTRKRYKPEEQSPDEAIYFSLPIIRILKEALTFFETLFRDKGDMLPNVSFAKAVVAELKGKLDDMLQREDWTNETPLDYNEIYLLYTSCAMYLIELHNQHKYELVPPCTSLCKQLSLVVEHVEKKAAQEKRKHEWKKGKNS